MSVIVHGGTMDAQKIVTVPTPRDGQILEALARYIPPGLVKQVLQRTGRRFPTAATAGILGGVAGYCYWPVG